MLSRECLKCNETKELSEYYKHSKGSGGYNTRCKLCVDEASRKWRENNSSRVKELRTRSYLTNKDKYRDEFLKKTYGVSNEDYKQMFNLQNGKCKICDSSSDKRLHIDHCHSTLAVRGLLCGNCNTALGLVKDNVETLNKMIAYLGKPLLEM